MRMTKRLKKIYANEWTNQRSRTRKCRLWKYVQRVSGLHRDNASWIFESVLINGLQRRHNIQFVLGRALNPKCRLCDFIIPPSTLRSSKMIKNSNDAINLLRFCPFLHGQTRAMPTRASASKTLLKIHSQLFF